MINILIKESDALFMLGMQSFLNTVFLARFNARVNFKTEFTPDNISSADVIVLSLSRGERYTCFPELQGRTKGIIVGLVDEYQKPELSPSCFVDIIYIKRNSALIDIAETLCLAWRKWQKSKVFEGYSTCLWCKRRQMSEQQVEIMRRFYEGKPINVISQELGVSPKTIFSHKYLVMQKYNLRNNIELMYFLQMLAQKENSPFQLTELAAC